MSISTDAISGVERSCVAKSSKLTFAMSCVMIFLILENICGKGRVDQGYSGWLEAYNKPATPPKPPTLEACGSVGSRTALAVMRVQYPLSSKVKLQASGGPLMLSLFKEARTSTQTPYRSYGSTRKFEY